MRNGLLAAAGIRIIHRQPVMCTSAPVMQHVFASRLTPFARTRVFSHPFLMLSYVQHAIPVAHRVPQQQNSKFMNSRTEYIVLVDL
jgi:hypothetical protein